MAASTNQLQSTNVASQTIEAQNFTPSVPIDSMTQCQVLSFADDREISHVGPAATSASAFQEVAIHFNKLTA